MSCLLYETVLSGGSSRKFEVGISGQQAFEPIEGLVAAWLMMRLEGSQAVMGRLLVRDWKKCPLSR